MADAAIWCAGRIIRARMFDRIMDAYERDPSLQSLLLAEHFRDAVALAEGAWRQGLTCGRGRSTHTSVLVHPRLL